MLLPRGYPRGVVRTSSQRRSCALCLLYLLFVYFVYVPGAEWWCPSLFDCVTYFVFVNQDVEVGFTHVGCEIPSPRTEYEGGLYVVHCLEHSLGVNIFICDGLVKHDAEVGDLSVLPDCDSENDCRYARVQNLFQLRGTESFQHLSLDVCNDGLRGIVEQKPPTCIFQRP